MRISKKGVYAIEALVYLSYRDEKLSITEIAKARNCSAKFLEHIFSALKKADILISTRGKNGGYSLKKDAEDITCKDIVIAVEDNLEPVACISGSCPQESYCMTRQLWINLQNELYKSLSKVSLHSLVEAYKEALVHEIDYQI
ncbi:RrF2 family transcriptional regulator [Breznakia pachnodae]|uniref:Rrf2 family iron-sulfur cluster assembly transcriptional regulator n=1 Tax=Breznakia pachnodae TaxID=265178 RepID=A0ABU0E7X6_9FIRM|nr:Rrf2 family transcriptional regulator [Breznakia pachnodae]MDQ0362809.1 Rrf2 family iron-sulfur cluster assembly transcriptional regulator [Breznakia pachnodae]